MALATRPRPKTVHHKKRQAKHHRHNKVYLKTYWPYLPVLAVAGAGYIANQHWPAGLVSVAGGAGQTRIEALTGSQNTWALALIIAMAGMAAAILLFRHWFRIQRTLNRGEAFVVHHPWFDVLLAILATLGILLTRSAHI
jgi:hypothetical protein